MNADELAALEKRVHLITRPEPALLWMYLLSSCALLCAAPFALVPPPCGTALKAAHLRANARHSAFSEHTRALVGIGTITIQTVGSTGSVVTV